MAYQQGDTITASDYNTFAGNINTVIGTGSGTSGYGLSEISTISAGDTISAAQWNSLLSGLQKAATHQGTSVTNASNSVSTGGNILPLSNFEADITAITSNKANAAGGNMSTGQAGTSSTRTSAWTSNVNHIFTVTFASANAARHFFNSGGKIKFAFSRSGGSSTPQNTAWTNLLSAAGTLTFANTAGGSMGSVGFENLTGSDQALYNSAVGSGDYSANDVNINGKISGAVITMEVDFNDDHTAETGTFTGGGLGTAPNEGAGYTGADSIDGTLSSTITFDKADNASAVQVASPSFSTTTNL
jgi:hypothetical protein